MPPANGSPTICRSWVVRGGEPDTQHRGRDDADQDGFGPLLLGQAGGGQADHDGVVARQDQVDHDHLEEGGEGFCGEKFAHVAPVFSWTGAAAMRRSRTAVSTPLRPCGRACRPEHYGRQNAMARPPD